MMTPTEHQLIVTILTGSISAAFGVGATFATLRGSIRKIVERVDKVEMRQEALRGSGGDVEPLFMRRTECVKHMTGCSGTLAQHSACIKGLRNYARYELAQKGLTQGEIKDILENGR